MVVVRWVEVFGSEVVVFCLGRVGSEEIGEEVVVGGEVLEIVVEG